MDFVSLIEALMVRQFAQHFEDGALGRPRG